MSASWELRLACDGCGAVTDDPAAAEPGHHGAALAILRAKAARSGWQVWSGQVKKRNDYCPACRSEGAG